MSGPRNYLMIGSAAAAMMFAMNAPASAISSEGYRLTIKGHPENHRGYVKMRHDTTYALCFRNGQSRRADAEVKIDGLTMGTWRLGPYQRACIERPADDNGRFTFYRANSAEGRAVGSADISRHDKGLVSVRFIPELRRTYRSPPVVEPHLPTHRRYGRPEMEQHSNGMGYSDSVADSAAPAPQAHKSRRHRDDYAEERLGAGVTGLSGRSRQRFRTAGSIERDYADAVTLQLRLVHDKGLEYSSGPRPLPGRYDRLAPPPVGN